MDWIADFCVKVRIFSTASMKRNSNSEFRAEIRGKIPRKFGRIRCNSLWNRYAANNEERENCHVRAFFPPILVTIIEFLLQCFRSKNVFVPLFCRSFDA